ncbi:MAG TPA: helix-turn-helix domain-containing protein [Planctomycetota bacterium]|nr:helix-turn-helix domain-containing protein [Planctomycetota bacterium]
MFSAKARSPLPAVFPPWGVLVLESRHARGFRMERTAHPFPKVCYALAGAGWIDLDRGRRPLAAGDVAVVPQGLPHVLRDDPERPLSLGVLCIRPEVLARVPEARGAVASLRVIRGRALGRALRPLFRRLFVEQSLGRPSCATMMTGLALEALALVQRAGEAHPMREDRSAERGSAAMARVQTYLRDLERRFFESDTIDAVAERLGLGRRTFTRLFRRAAGRPWHDHLRALRIRHAQRLLADPGRTILWVSLECGFENLSTFYRAFQAVAGTTPARWRSARARRRGERPVP